jgi:hypothetical protein
VRRRLRTVFQECAAGGRRVAIFGRGEAAELAYLSLKEAGLEPVAIFDGESGPEFLGMPVHAIRDHAEIEYDLIIVATLERSAQQLVTVLLDNGVPRDKLISLRQEPAPPRKAGDAARSGNGQHA